VVVNWLMVAVAAWTLRTQHLYRPYEIWKALERPHWPTLAEFARLGVPGGLSVMVDVTSFTLMSLFIARQGTASSAAHQIAANLAAVMYMVPLSLAIATSARVSFWLGANEPKHARHAIRTGFKIAVTMAVTMSSLVLALRWQLASIYSPSAEVVTLAAGLIALLALYHLGDSTVAMCVFVLRCYRVVIAPFVAYVVVLWGVGLAGGYTLAYVGVGPLHAQHSPAAFWEGGAAGLLLLAPIVAAILWRSVHRDSR
jgi:MATE family multidrug resistance protein